MRPIDADKFEVISWRAQGGREYASGFDDGVDYMVKKIDDAPTIDAIPVEWLEEQADYARSEWDYDTCEGIRMVLKAWQKEQEAR